MVYKVKHLFDMYKLFSFKMRIKGFCQTKSYHDWYHIFELFGMMINKEVFLIIVIKDES